MKPIIFLIIILTVGYSTSRSPKTNDPVKVIFDTDMGPDFDDVGAIAILHALAAKGECEILACCASDRHPAIAPTIEAFNTYFDRTDIPVGEAVENTPDFTAENHWNDSIVAKFLPKEMMDNDYPSAVSVYRKVLASQPDQSVTIITVGFLSNLEQLLKSGSDQYSSLTGFELVKKKVKNWVAMAGGFPQGYEFNLIKDIDASCYTLQNWPTPILFSGFEIGNNIYTGAKVADKGSIDNPVAWAYRYNFNTYRGKKSTKRNSWDLTAVLCAVRNPEKYFYVNGPGKFIVHEDGRNEWNPDATTNHYFLVHKYPYQYVANLLDELMMYEPK